MLTAITGEYVTGAPTTDKGHPFRLSFHDLEVGDSLTTESRVVTSEDITHFAEFTGDTFYAHMDEEAAARSPIFGGIVAHGYLVLSFAAGLFVDPPEGPVLANYGIDRLRFATPTKPGDEIHVVLTCKRKTWLEDVATARWPGTPRSSTSTARSPPSTTSSRWSEARNDQGGAERNDHVGFCDLDRKCRGGQVRS